MRRGGYKYRTLEMNLQLRDQQLKTISYTYSPLYQNFKITANQKLRELSNTKPALQQILKELLQVEKNKRRRKEKRTEKQIQSN